MAQLVRDIFIQSGTTRLQAFEAGYGPRQLVLVHGFRASARIWRLVQEALDPDRFRSLAISNRGAGDSDRGHSEDDYLVESFARDLHAALSGLGLRDFTLVGHSLGALTSMHYALEHQDLLNGLVLVDPAVLDGATLTGPPAANDVRPPGEAYDEAFARRDVVDALHADMDHNPPQRVSAGRKSLARANMRQRLRELRVPTLVMGGDRDDTVGVHNILTEYLMLPEEIRSLHIIHGAGHSPSLSMPGEVAAVLSRFVMGGVPFGSARPATEELQI